MNSTGLQNRLCGKMRAWAETADPEEDAESAITDIVEDQMVMMMDADVIQVCTDNDLWSEFPESIPPSRTPMGYMEAVVLDWCTGILRDEWNKIARERDNGDVYWCVRHDEWHEEGEGVYCDDCGAIVDREDITQFEDGQISFCEDCAQKHCYVCGASLDDGEGYDGVCGKCADKTADVE